GDRRIERAPAPLVPCPCPPEYLEELLGGPFESAASVQLGHRRAGRVSAQDGLEALDLREAGVHDGARLVAVRMHRGDGDQRAVPGTRVRDALEAGATHQPMDETTSEREGDAAHGSDP